jgi:hypothetical protein
MSQNVIFGENGNFLQNQKSFFILNCFFKFGCTFQSFQSISYHFVFLPFCILDHSEFLKVCGITVLAYVYVTLPVTYMDNIWTRCCPLWVNTHPFVHPPGEEERRGEQICPTVYMSLTYGGMLAPSPKYPFFASTIEINVPNGHKIYESGVKYINRT